MPINNPATNSIDNGMWNPNTNNIGYGLDLASTGSGPVIPTDITWGDGTNITWGDGTQAQWSGT